MDMDREEIKYNMDRKYRIRPREDHDKMVMMGSWEDKEYMETVKKDMDKEYRDKLGYTKYQREMGREMPTPSSPAQARNRSCR